MTDAFLTFESAEPLLASKLHMPAPSLHLVPRPRLLAHLAQAKECKVTLLSAPAGSGKTALLSLWLASLADCDVFRAWLSLDEGDSDPARFWRYIWMALRPLDLEERDDLLKSLQVPPLPSISRFLPQFINMLSMVPRPFILVLDDYHLISTPAIHQGLTFLVEHLPEPMHLIISSREIPPLPLARWRARGLLAEIHAEELCFTLPEATTFLTEGMGLDLTADAIARLVARTEGWITGLYLAALSLRARNLDQTTQFLSTFAGSHRSILDYLTKEVLQRQPEHVQQFLLQTSLLNRLNGPLCDAVTESTDSQILLEQLEQRNLFIVPLDNERCWYRYHQLLADALKHHLSRELHQSTLHVSLSLLHSRASRWYEQHQWLAEAIHHALGAEEFDRAARLCEMMMQVSFAREELSTLLYWFATLKPAILRHHPHLCLYYLRMLIFSGRLQAAREQLEETERVLCEQGEQLGREERRTLTGELALVRALLTLLQGDIILMRTLCQQAQCLLPADHLVRGEIPLLLGMAHWLNGEVVQASARLIEASKIGRASDNRYFFSAARFFLAQTRAAQGYLQEALGLCRDALGMTTACHCRQGEIGGPLETAGTVLSTSGVGQVLLPRESGIANLAMLLYEQNNLEEAERCVQQGLALGQAEGNVFDAISGKIILAYIRQARGDAEEAHDLMQQAIRLAWLYDVSWTWAIPSVAVSEIRLALAQGERKAVAQWAQQRPREAISPAHPALLRGEEEIMLARVCLVLGQPREALSRLSRLHAEAEVAGRGRQMLEILILQALGEYALNETAQAFSALTLALKLAAQEGYVRLFVDEGAPMVALLQQLQALHDTTPPFVDTLLAAFPPPQACEVILYSQAQPPMNLQPLPEPLTEREREILRSMATGASNQEIAEQLVIAVSTAKRHVSNILSKLEASSRTQAVTRARELGLL